MSERTDVFRYPQQLYGTDVAPFTVRLEDGWHALERHDGVRFRWARSGATFSFIACGALDTIYLDLEPGPSVAALPADFEVRVGDLARTFPIFGRRTISFVCPPTPASIVSVRLSVAGGGADLESDDRILDLRIFRIAVGRRAPEVVPVWEGVDVKRGWYLTEGDGREIFRWVNASAQIEITEPRRELILDVEPSARAMRDRPFELEVDIGQHRAHQRFVLDGRASIAIRIPEDSVLPMRIVLRTVTPADPPLAIGPIGNLRVFRYRGEDGAEADEEQPRPTVVAPATFSPYLA